MKRSRSAKKKITFHAQRLLQYDFNLKHVMGSLLRKKWDFGRRDEAQEAYQVVFGMDKAAKDEMRDIFRNRDLQSIAALRNALVHRGGIADDEFTSLVKQHPTLNAIEAGKPIPLDGSLIAPLVENAKEHGLRLLNFVNARIHDKHK